MNKTHCLQCKTPITIEPSRKTISSICPECGALLPYFKEENSSLGSINIKENASHTSTPTEEAEVEQDLIDPEFLKMDAEDLLSETDTQELIPESNSEESGPETDLERPSKKAFEDTDMGSIILEVESGDSHKITSDPHIEEGVSVYEPPPPVELSNLPQKKSKEDSSEFHISDIVSISPEEFASTDPEEKGDTDLSNSNLPPTRESLSVLYDLFVERKLELPFQQKESFQAARYSFIKKLAQGGMGQIDLIQDNDLKRQVARKTILSPSKSSRNNEILNRFIHEAQTTGQLEHPNIISIHEIGLDNKRQIYFTMEFVKGQNLHQILRKLQKKEVGIEEEYSLTRLLQIFKQICHALAFAHSKKVIHRDLKPENIMIGSFGEVLLMDWGLAKVIGEDLEWDLKSSVEEESENVETVRNLLGRQTVDGSVVGTIYYMSPEQAYGEIKNLDEKSDIFSLGAILYELLTLETPYQGKTYLELLQKVTSAKIRPIEETAKMHQRYIDRELKAIVLKAMSKTKEERYEDAQELASEIQRYLEGKAILALPDTLSKKVFRAIRQNATLLKQVSATLGVVLLTLFLIHFWSVHSSLNHLLKEGRGILAKATTFYQANKTQKIYGGGPPPSKIEVLKMYQEAANIYRNVLDLAPDHQEARQKLQQISFQLWKLAFQEKNNSLMEIQKMKFATT